MKTAKVNFPQFAIYSNPSIRLYHFNHDEIIINSKNQISKDDIRLSSLIYKVAYEIMAREDEEIFKVLDQIASGNKEV